MSLIGAVNCAQETLTSQAYGSGDLKLCGTYLNRGRMVCLAFCIPLSFLFYFSEDIFLFLRQPPQVAYYAGMYIRVQVVSLFLSGQYDIMKKFLIQMQVTWAALMTSIVCTALHLLWIYFFIIKWGWSIYGIGLAVALTYLLQFTSLTTVSLCVPRIRDAIFCPNADSFKGWDQYIAIVVPVMIIFCAESWAFEVIQILTGYIGLAEQAAMVILIQLSTLMLMVSAGEMEGLASLIGFATGANNPGLARRIFNIATAISIVSNLIIVAFVYSYRSEIAHLFTKNTDVIEVVLNVFPIMCFMFVFDSIGVMSQGAIRGLGQQNRVASQTMLAYWLVGIPVGVVLTFYFDYGLKGLWYGLTTAVLLQLYAYLSVLLTTDWQVAANEAHKRIQDAKAKASADAPI